MEITPDKKYVITFGNTQLSDFNVNPINVALVIEAYSEKKARGIAYKVKGIENRFAFSYPYEKYYETLKELPEEITRNIKEYTIEDLEKLRK